MLTGLAKRWLKNHHVTKEEKEELLNHVRDRDYVTKSDLMRARRKLEKKKGK